MTSVHRAKAGRRVGPVALATVIAVVAFGLTVATSGAATPNPSSGTSYELIPSPGITWYQAQAAAEAAIGVDGCRGHLATITSLEESNFIKFTFGPDLQMKWIGGFQPIASDKELGWTWVTDEPWSFTDWGSGEPNNLNSYGPPYEQENALVFLLYGGVPKWNDAPANWNKYAAGGYLVEYECRQVAIDVKPGSFPNSINNDGNGVIPVAILTTETFDAATVDPFTVTLDGATVRVKGKSGNAGSLEDVDGDGDLDLVVQILDVDSTYVLGVDATAFLTAFTYAGEKVTGSDSIRLVPA